MRIAITINTSWNIYNFRKGLVERLLAEGHEVFAIAPSDEYSEKLVELGCTYIEMPMDNKGSNPFNDYVLIRRLKSAYRSIKPDVILQYTIKPNIYGTIAAKSLRIPVINNVSGLGTIFITSNNLTAKIGLFLYRVAFKYPKKVFFQNSDDRDLFLEKGLVNREITDVLPGSGVDLQHFREVNRYEKGKPFRFLFIGRLLFDKGIAEYAEAAKALKSRFEDIEFAVLGLHDSSKGSVPKDMLDNWIQNKVVNYLGIVDDVRPVISQSHCVVLPSYREGTPKTLLEAAAMSKPIVATNVAGCKEVVNGENGYLCEVKSAEKLANSMEKIRCLDETSLREMAAESRKLAETKFDQEIVINKYLDEIKKWKPSTVSENSNLL